MQKFLILITVILGSIQLNAQQAKVVKFPELNDLINSKSDKIQVFNFWATWCGPCIKELPYFEAAREKMGDKIEVNLVSVDFVEELSKVNKFITRKNLKSNIYLIDDIDYNSWIDKVDTKWSGAIPATLVINTTTGERTFVEHELKEGELEKMITELIN
ncbi:MAG TPA: TlpA disulfide reductase family protein [Fulvivirga sp.]|nr:TlpA disulfide reductase family protein [Fulvivirga sp.]